MTINKKLALAAMAMTVAGTAALVVRARAAVDYPRALATSPMNALLLETGAPPPIAAVDEKGHAKSADGAKGRWLLLNLWFSDCAPCREEMPSLHALAEKVGPKGLSVVALSVDPSWEKVRAFHAGEPALSKVKPAYELWLDEKKVTPLRFGTFKFPETFLIDPKGRLRARFVGPRDWASADSIALFTALTR